jgi:DNA-binding MarR family transcriptional regulator
MAEVPLSRILLDAFRVLDAEIESGLRDHGVDLSPSHASGILLIDRGGTRLSELASRARISKQAMMQVVDDLESKGLVRRAPDPSDSRAKIVKLTARGLRQRAEARRAVATVETRARRLLGNRRYDALRTALADLTTGEQ